MVSFKAALFALAGAAVAFAQSDCSGINCFTNSDYLGLAAGKSFTFTWNNLTGSTVTLQLRQGNSAYLGTTGNIATNIQNTGTYTWNIPMDIVNGNTYAVEIIDDQDTSKVNYTPQFSISSTILTTSTSSGAVSSTAMSSSATSSGSMTTSMSSSASSSGTSSMTTTTSSSSQSAGVQQTSTKSGSAHRATAVAGMLGMVALGALAL